MGLDIAAYEHAVLTEPHEYGSDACYDAKHVHVYVNDGFEHALGSLVRNRCYLVSGREINFRTGSYSGYNEWRSALARSALSVSPEKVWTSPDAFRDKPFYELINFSDCEGTVGPEVCRKLADDFSRERDRVRPLLAEIRPTDYFAQKYDEWEAAFDLASSDGLVSFQ